MLEVRERGNIRGDPQGRELTVTGNWSTPDEPVAKLKGLLERTDSAIIGTRNRVDS